MGGGGVIGWRGRVEASWPPAVGGHNGGYAAGRRPPRPRGPRTEDTTSRGATGVGQLRADLR